MQMLTLPLIQKSFQKRSQTKLTLPSNWKCPNKHLSNSRTKMLPRLTRMSLPRSTPAATSCSSHQLKLRPKWDWWRTPMKTWRLSWLSWTATTKTSLWLRLSKLTVPHKTSTRDSSLIKRNELRLCLQRLKRAPSSGLTPLHRMIARNCSACWFKPVTGSTLCQESAAASSTRWSTSSSSKISLTQQPKLFLLKPLIESLSTFTDFELSKRTLPPYDIYALFHSLSLLT